MWLGANIAIGLIVGKLTANYTYALIGAVAIDLDHAIPYLRHKILFQPKKLWQAMINREDPYGSQRNIMHSFITWAVISVIIFLIDRTAGFVISIAYLAHLFLDLADSSDFRPFFPINWNVRGPIKYLSRTEIMITVALFVIFLIL